MKRKKLIIASVVLSVLLLAGVIGAGVVLAQSTNTNPPIIQKFAEKFNVSTDDVKEVFDEVREERRKEAQIRFEEQLNEAVKDGKITEEQKKVILEKQAEIMKQQEEVFKLRQELKTWADENNIDLREICGPGPGHKRGGFRGGGFGPGPRH